MVRPLPVYAVTRASGAELCVLAPPSLSPVLLVDGMSSWWCAIHGYSHPVLVDALTRQARDMAHVMFGGITHPPAVALARTLLQILPPPLECIFYADSGSVSIEVALKMCVQYHHSLNPISPKANVMTVLGGYHGDTWNAMSVCDPVTGMHSLYGSSLPVRIFIPKPLTPFDAESLLPQDITALEEAFAEHGSSVAAFIIEPVVQGAGGMRFYSPLYLQLLRKLCTQHDVLLVFDEIATGFGRTGKLFACEWVPPDDEGKPIFPDIMTIGKALTGGMMTMGATIATRKVADVVSNGPSGCFMHGPTFMGNPLACAVANASCKLLLEGPWQARVRNIERLLKLGLEPAQKFQSVAEVRVLGAIGVVEVRRDVDMGEIQKRFVELGVWVRPFGKLVYLMPPFIVSEEQLRRLTDAVCAIVKDLPN
ncbi:hypothetical protein HDU84_004598 [Entophlyctis sp. JEL0112]|nr:hypothetical protein HDU84_004598 [Entophlyctis sp. JEL0112]